MSSRTCANEDLSVLAICSLSQWAWLAPWTSCQHEGLCPRRLTELIGVRHMWRMTCGVSAARCRWNLELLHQSLVCRLWLQMTLAEQGGTLISGVFWLLFFNSRKWRYIIRHYLCQELRYTGLTFSWLKVREWILKWNTEANIGKRKQKWHRIKTTNYLAIWLTEFLFHPIW